MTDYSELIARVEVWLKGVTPVFIFDRYINGVLMAEGVTIERQPDLASAAAVAARIAPRGPNGESPVLVHITPARQDVPELLAALKAVMVQVRESAMQELASLGQAQEAYEAQKSAEAELARLRVALEACVASLERADTSEGVCCCGDCMDNHSDLMSCGHSPVDMGDYYARMALDAARDALADGGKNE